MSTSYETSDDISVDSDSDSQESESTSHSSFTCSQSYSSPSVSVPIALDPFRAPLPSTLEEMNSEINRLRMTAGLMQKELVRVTAQIVISKARWAMKRAETEAKAEFEQEMLRFRQAVKASACYVTHAAIRA
jgi:hypothetical protein